MAKTLKYQPVVFCEEYEDWGRYQGEEGLYYDEIQPALAAAEAAFKRLEAAPQGNRPTQFGVICHNWEST